MQQSQIKFNKHDSEYLTFLKYYLYGAPQTKNLKNKSILGKEFAKWQIKIKKHDLGNTIP